MNTQHSPSQHALKQADDLKRPDKHNPDQTRAYRPLPDHETARPKKEKSTMSPFIQLGVVEVKRSLKEEILEALREMNINNAVLFPDLAGFCESLWTRVELTLIDKSLTKDKGLTLY
jgi:hypothetical protein